MTDLFGGEDFRTELDDLVDKFEEYFSIFGIDGDRGAFNDVTNWADDYGYSEQDMKDAYREAQRIFLEG